MINILVALSNLVTLPLIYNNSSPFKYFMIFPMLASFFYHLGETKHGLPGVYPLNRYDKRLLNVDRFFAVASGLAVIGSIFTHPEFLTTKFLIIGILGLTSVALSLLYSERDYLQNILIKYELPYKWTNVSPFEFFISHSIWHFAAFYCLDLSIRYS